MKRILFLFVFAVACVLSIQAQRLYHFWNVYTEIDSLVLENAQANTFTAGGDYIINLPRHGKVVIAYNKDHSKAIVLKTTGPLLVRHMEYNVKDDETRTVLYYKDEHIYCGYIYDKRIKAGRYFEAINEDEKEKLIERIPFLKHMPTFTD